MRRRRRRRGGEGEEGMARSDRRPRRRHGGGGAARATLPRFAIPISYMRHPLFMGLLEAAQDVYGYPSAGPLKLPCSVDDFIHLRRLIERGPPISGNHRCPRRRSFSLNTC
ncbi:unnamed protein product [Spirodela intermedia]|uniref:Uncharacterized protein n=1 Tax=Spirodela intermedia TaxID=51605 RepID=A0A7I8IMB6_SPIIN|nr:unnamed protein product [Spirodela intermedia]CAA6658899.1 unnamed protein product [Spirodela intermedia]